MQFDRINHIEARRWFSRTNGCTLHRVYIHGSRDGREVCHNIGTSYGYGNQWETTAREWLKDNGYVPDNIRYFPDMCLYLKCTSSCTDVQRKKDL